MENFIKLYRVVIIWTFFFLFETSIVFGQQVYSEICDASAAVAINSSHFLVAHDEAFEDEGDTLYLYRNDGFAIEEGRVQPLKKFNLKKELQIHSLKESDIEGAARIDNRVFWITSHGRNKKGKIKKNRYRLFATDISGSSAQTEITFSGGYDKLAKDMQVIENWAFPQSEITQQTVKILKDSLRLGIKKIKSLKPKVNGLNIEALAALPDKAGLLIGLRNPIPNGKALIIQLLNAHALVFKEGSVAKFGQPILLDLKGRGIRSMDYVPTIDAFLILAGPKDNESSFKLYKWSQNSQSKLVEIGDLLHFEGANPEALIAYEKNRRIQILYDEGTRMIDGVKCKNTQKQTRSFSDQWYAIE